MLLLDDRLTLQKTANSSSVGYLETEVPSHHACLNSWKDLMHISGIRNVSFGWISVQRPINRFRNSDLAVKRIERSLRKNVSSKSFNHWKSDSFCFPRGKYVCQGYVVATAA